MLSCSFREQHYTVKSLSLFFIYIVKNNLNQENLNSLKACLNDLEQAQAWLLKNLMFLTTIDFSKQSFKVCCSVEPALSDTGEITKQSSA